MSDNEIIVLNENIVLNEEDFYGWRALLNEGTIKDNLEKYGAVKIKMKKKNETTNAAGRNAKYYENFIQNTKSSAFVKVAHIKQLKKGICIDEKEDSSDELVLLSNFFTNTVKINENSYNNLSEIKSK